MLIGGETVTDLVEALRGLEFEPSGDGSMVQVSGVIGPPATRALMRLEAELLFEDADEMAATSRLVRTNEQRQADAFMRLTEELSAAAGVARRRGPAV